jgi:hypothetical protein
MNESEVEDRAGATPSFQSASEFDKPLWERMRLEPPNGVKGRIGNWAITLRDPVDILQNEPTFLACELEFYVLAILTFIHAHRYGYRYMLLWWTTVAHGLFTECTSYWYPDIDNFWHGQSMVMMWGWREPLHIILLYPGFIYPVVVTAERLQLWENIQPFFVALGDVMIDFPYDIMGIKLLWWTWHDSDGNIYERSYWVPWTSYHFHMTFACSFTFLYNYSRRYFTGLSGLISEADVESLPFAQRRLCYNWVGELKAMLLTGFLTFPVGTLQV